MWKRRPIIASGVGGIQDQVRDGVDGLLLADPVDLPSFAAAARRLLQDRDEVGEMGQSAHERVRDNYLVDRDLGEWVELMGRFTGR